MNFLLQRILQSDVLKYGIIFGCYGLLSLFLITKGLDLTDTGYHLANQMNVATLGINYMGVLPIYWFSDVVAAWLSNLFGGWTLLEMRATVLTFGVVQLIVLLRIVSLSGIKLTYLNTSFFTLLGLLMTVPFGCVLLSVDYYTLPTLASYLYLPILMSFFYRPHILKVVALALLTLFILNLRFTTGFVLLATPLFVAVLIRLAGKEAVTFKKQLAFFYGLCAVLVGAEIAWILSDKDISHHILSGDWKNDKVHNTFDIFKSYFKDFFKELGRSLFLPLGLLFAAGYSAHKEWHAHKKIKIKKSDILSVLPYCMAVSWVLMLSILGDKTVSITKIVVLSYAMYLLVFAILYVRAADFVKKNAALILAGALIPMAIFIGTNTGLSKLGYGIPILITTLYFMVLHLPVYKKPILFFVMVFYLSGLTFVVLKSTDQFYENVRLNPASGMTYQMQQGKIKGVYTAPNSGPAIDELLVEIDRRTEKGDKIYTALSIPMVYFASDRPNVLNDIPNFDIFQPEKVLLNKLPRLCSSSETTPKLIVVSRKYVFDPNWEKNVDAAKSLPTGNGWGEQDNGELINKLVAENCRPKIVWENTYFQIQIPATQKKK